MTATPSHSAPVPPPALRRGAVAVPAPEPGADTSPNGAGDQVAVLLVGRTGIDAALRLDPLIELHRADSGAAAIGQLSLLEARPGAVPVVVVLGPGTDPTQQPDAFTRAVGLISPGARVARIRASATDAPANPAAPAADTIVPLDPGTDASTIRTAIRAIARPPHRATETVRADSESPRPLPARAATTPFDTALVQALLTGRDPTLPALDTIRAALGTQQVHFMEVIPGVQHAAPHTDPAPQGAPISHSGHTYGRLVAPAVPADALVPWADWLGHWFALRDQQEQLRAGALIDDLTGAWNRRYFDRFLQAAITHAAEHSHHVTVLYFDIDNFKSFNDTYGHAAGDEILRETVRLLLSVIRPTDRVCRIGGDEFGVIFHEPDGPRDAGSKPPTSIWSIADRFQRQIREHRFPKLLDQALGTLTISGGLASFPADGATPAELVGRADQLAIESKREGKNAIRLGQGAERVCRPQA